jgi:hypothetical protein
MRDVTTSSGYGAMASMARLAERIAVCASLMVCSACTDGMRFLPISAARLRLHAGKGDQHYHTSATTATASKIKILVRTCKVESIKIPSAWL